MTKTVKETPYSSGEYQIDALSHLLKSPIRVVNSPNCDERPHQEAPSLIVVHGISLPPNQFGGAGVEQLFTNRLDPNEHPYYETIKGLEVSAHCFIRRTGELIQFVPFNKRAWHAGKSTYLGRERCNDFSIGIELEGTDVLAYEAIQYEVLSRLINALRVAYPSIASSALVGHSDIAPGRKTDPGKVFDWNALNAKLVTT